MRPLAPFPLPTAPAALYLEQPPVHPSTIIINLIIAFIPPTMLWPFTKTLPPQRGRVLAPTTSEAQPNPIFPRLTTSRTDNHHSSTQAAMKRSVSDATISSNLILISTSMFLRTSVQNRHPPTFLAPRTQSKSQPKSSQLLPLASSRSYLCVNPLLPLITELFVLQQLQQNRCWSRKER